MSAKLHKRTTQLLYEKESYLIQGAFFEVYKRLRNNYKESVIHNALFQELNARGLKVEKNKAIVVLYRGQKVGTYIPDLVVNDAILIEIKCKPFLHKEDIKQFWYYLKGSDYKVGYLVNFGKPDGVEFIRRVYDTARKV